MDPMKLNHQSHSKFKVVLCELKCINLENKTFQIFGCHYLYNKSIHKKKKFKSYVALKMCWKV